MSDFSTPENGRWSFQTSNGVKGIISLAFGLRHGESAGSAVLLASALPNLSKLFRRARAIQYHGFPLLPYNSRCPFFGIVSNLKHEFP